MTRSYVHIRWMIARDMPEVMEIERAKPLPLWNEAEMLSILRRRSTVGMVAEQRDQVLGFMVYDLKKDVLILENFAVHPDYRRIGIGTQLIDKLVAKLSKHRRSILRTVVPESCLESHLFLRAYGLRATGVERGAFWNPQEDGYIFTYHVGEPAPAFSIKDATR